METCCKTPETARKEPEQWAKLFADIKEDLLRPARDAARTGSVTVEIKLYQGGVAGYAFGMNYIKK